MILRQRGGENGGWTRRRLLIFKRLRLIGWVNQHGGRCAFAIGGDENGTAADNVGRLPSGRGIPSVNLAGTLLGIED
jgi:hypothetical protein